MGVRGETATRATTWREIIMEKKRDDVVGSVRFALFGSGMVVEECSSSSSSREKRGDEKNKG